MTRDKKKRLALITGAGRGIGRAIALRLAKEDIALALTARTENELKVVADEIAALGRPAFYVPCDVSSQTNVNVMVDEVMERADGIDILVNCAGRGGGGRTVDMDDDLWHEIFNTNFHSVYYTSKAVLRNGNMQNPGCVINIASTGGKQGVLYAAAYCASKHAIVGFSKSLGRELASQGITVNAVCPGFVETEMARKARQGYGAIWNLTGEQAGKKLIERVPIGRYIMPDEVAEMVAYLVSDKARGVTAQAMNVCGGLGNY